jgi:putative nucleotidyltransferase with HDIG domain
MSHAELLTRRLVDHDPGVVDHAARVTDLALRLATELDAPPQLLRRLAIATPLHDIGKLDVDPAILAKPGPLDDAEAAEIRRHPVSGTEILEGIQSLRTTLATVLHHHERWDGEGYPHGLHGDEIPPEARIVAVADAYDAMVSDRPYRSRLAHTEAVAEVERCAGAQFDPRVAEAFLRLVS